MRLLLYVRVLAAALPLAVGSVASAQVTEDPKPPPNVFEMSWVSFPSADCAPQAGGAGASPDDPVEIVDFVDLFGSALTWKTPEEGQQANDWERKHDVEVTPDLNCRWVRISGYFRRTDYQHYRGTLDENSRAFYLKGGPNGPIRQGAYFIESWHSQETSSALINGSDIEIIGQFYDLCRAAREAEKQSGKKWFILGGPCHYGELTGLMIRDARILAVRIAPPRRLTGEANRPVIGDIREIPKSWGDYGRVKAAAIDWIKTIRQGPTTYWTRALTLPNPQPEEPARTEEIERQANDPDNWISFLSLNPKSPVVKQSQAIEDNEFRLFRLQRYGGGETEEKIRITYACFCTQRRCGDVWPLFSEDAESFHNDTLCVRIDRFRRDEQWDW